MAVPVGMPDHALLTRARDGDGEAFEALYRRHHRAATRAAHSYSSRGQLAEDAVQEAFLRILRATQAGGGPETEFRAYLATTVRHVIAGWTRSERDFATDELEALAGEDVRETTAPESRLRWHLLTKAFKSLPTRWQEALWLGEVEGVEISELAERWNMSPNAASALAYRARDGLRTAWLDAHVNEGLVQDGCRPFVADLGRYTQDKLTARREQQVREHLDSCDYCRAVLFEVGRAASELRVLLLPVVLWGGSAVAAALVAGGASGVAAKAGPVAAVTRWGERLGARGVAGGLAVVAVVVAIAVLAPRDADADGDTPGDAAPTVQTDGTGGAGDAGDDSGDGGTTAGGDDADPAPTADPTDNAIQDPFDPPADDPRDDSPADPPDPTGSPDPVDPIVPTDPVDPTEPTDPTDPTDPIQLDPPAFSYEVDAEGVLLLVGTGDPGATITVRTAGSSTVGAATTGGVAGRAVLPRIPREPDAAPVEVEDDGSWSLVVPDAMYGQRVEAVQTLHQRESRASDVVALPDRLSTPTFTVDEPPTDGMSPIGLSGTGGDPGATVRITLAAAEGRGTALATTVVGADGSWHLTVPFRTHSGASLVAIQVATGVPTSRVSNHVTLPAYQLPPPTIGAVFDGGSLVVSGFADPGATIELRRQEEVPDEPPLGVTTADSGGAWQVLLGDDAGGTTVFAAQRASEGDFTSNSASLVLPVRPAPPTILSAVILLDTVTVLGTGTEPDAELVFTLEDGTVLEPASLSMGLGLGFTATIVDDRLTAGDAIYVAQVVDDVSSERASATITLGIL